MTIEVSGENTMALERAVEQRQLVMAEPLGRIIIASANVCGFGLGTTRHLADGQFREMLTQDPELTDRILLLGYHLPWIFLRERRIAVKPVTLRELREKLPITLGTIDDSVDQLLLPFPPLAKKLQDRKAELDAGEPVKDIEVLLSIMDRDLLLQNPDLASDDIKLLKTWVQFYGNFIDALGARQLPLNEEEYLSNSFGSRVAWMNIVLNQDRVSVDMATGQVESIRSKHPKHGLMDLNGLGGMIRAMQGLVVILSRSKDQSEQAMAKEYGRAVAEMIEYYFGPGDRNFVDKFNLRQYRQFIMAEELKEEDLPDQSERRYP